MSPLQKTRVRKLVAELRSGLWPQTTGTLHNDQGFCCMGVACNVAKDDGCKVSTVVSAAAQVKYGASLAFMPLPVQNWYGFTGGNPAVNFRYPYKRSTLAELNDSIGLSLPQIADVIEANFLPEDVKK